MPIRNQPQRPIWRSGTGCIQLPLGTFREVASDDIQALAAVGGIMASDSTPALARVNGATDKALRLTWAGADVTEVQADSIVLPYDLDPSAPMRVYLRAGMAGSTDTPTIDVQVYFGVGDTECGAATAALSDTVANVYAEIAASDIASSAIPMSISLVPAAHGTDALYLYGAWIEYIRL